jgi:DNA-directed RNA polymerase subunit RPC12/RpoP
MPEKIPYMEEKQPNLAGVRCSHCGIMDCLRKMASRVMQLVYSCTNCHGKTTIKTGMGTEGQKQMTGNRSDHGPNRSESEDEHKCCLSNK